MPGDIVFDVVKLADNGAWDAPRWLIQMFKQY